MSARTGFIIFLTINFIVASTSNSYFCTDDMVCGSGIKTHPFLYADICKPCKCNGVCAEHTFCHLSNANETNAAKCVHQYSFLNKTHILRDFPSYLQRSYYVIAKCPLRASIEEKFQCESSLKMENLYYVSGVSSLKIYKNEMCAKCNGEHAYIHWRHAVAMSSEDMVNVTQGFQELLSKLKERNVVSVPPDGYPEYVNECRQNDITKCNVTGLWKSYDENIYELCDYPLNAAINTINAQVFKNVYCALCNSEDGTSRCSLVDLNDKNIGNVPFVSLITWQVDEISKDELRKEHRCFDNEIMDPLENVCRRISCPLGQYAIAGSCKTRLVSLWDINLNVYFKAIIDENVFANVSEVQIAKAVRNNFLKDLVCLSCPTLSCLKEEEETGNAVICSVWFLTTLHCKMGDLIGLLNPTDKLFSVEIPVVTYVETVNLIFNIVFPKIFHSTPSTCYKPVIWKLPQKYYCTSIVVSNTSAKTIGNFGLADNLDNLSEDIILDDDQSFSLQQNTSKIICLSDYLDIVNQINGSNKCYSTKGIYITLLIMLMIIIHVS